MTQRILILEDDSALAHLMASMLEDAGYEPAVAASPEHAQGTYDLIVSDYLAPTYVPGEPWPHLDLLRHLAQGGPILGCTGHQDALHASPASLGIAAIALKPFDVDSLLGTIQELLDRHTVFGERDETTPEGMPRISPIKDAARSAASCGATERAV